MFSTFCLAHQRPGGSVQCYRKRLLHPGHHRVLTWTKVVLVEAVPAVRGRVEPKQAGDGERSV